MGPAPSIFLLLLAGLIGGQQPLPRVPSPVDGTYEAVDRFLTSDQRPENVNILLRRYFPEDYRNMVVEIAARVHRRETPQEINDAANTMMAAFYARNGRYSQFADAVTLRQTVHTQRLLAEALANSDASACSYYARFSLIPDTVHMTPALARAIAADNRSQLMAVYQGLHSSGPIADLTPADRDNIVSRYTAVGGSNTYILNPPALAALSQPEQCRLGVALWQIIDALPDDVASKYMADWFGRAARDAAASR